MAEGKEKAKVIMGWRVAFVAAVMLVGVPSLAHAEMVRLVNGRLMVDIESCVYDGDRVIVTFRSGTVIGMPSSQVDEIMPDEVPYARAVALEAYGRVVSPPPGTNEVYDLVGEVALRLGLDPRLAHAIVRVESAYNPYAVSSKGAMGLMQLMPATARQYGVSAMELYDAERNLETGMRHFLGLLRRFDLTLALAAYNAGEGAVTRYGGIPPYRETRAYVQKIMALYIGS